VPGIIQAIVGINPKKGRSILLDCVPKFGEDFPGLHVYRIITMVMVSSQAIQQPLRVAILAGDGPLATLETGKGIDAVGILCNSTRNTHGVRGLPAIPVPLPSRKAKSLLGGREGLSGEVACPLAHIPIMSILSSPSTPICHYQAATVSLVPRLLLTGTINP
jgi:hypothetical protein